MVATSAVAVQPDPGQFEMGRVDLALAQIPDGARVIARMPGRLAGHERDTAASLGSGMEPLREIRKTSFTLEQFHRMFTRGTLG